MRFSSITKSLGFRLAALTALFIAAMLTVFAVGSSYWLIGKGRQILDQSLRAQATNALGSASPYIDWQQFEAQLRNAFSPSEGPTIAFFYQGNNRGNYYRCREWPLELDPAAVVPGLERSADWKTSWVGDKTSPLQQSDHHSTLPLALAAPGKLQQQLKPIVRTPHDVAGQRWRIAAYRADHGILILAYRTQHLLADLGRLRSALFAAIPIAALLAFFSGSLIGHHTLQPVRKLATTMAEVTVKGLGQRVDINATVPELRAVLEMFNLMLARLERSFDEMRRFAGLTAHELKTPLTILRAKIDIALHQEAPRSPRQQLLASLQDEVTRLAGTTDMLLLLAQADASRLELYLTDIRLSEVLEEIVEDGELLAPAMRVMSIIEPGVIIRAVRNLLMLVLHNLLYNAIRHNSGGSGAFIKIELRQKEDDVEIIFSN